MIGLVPPGVRTSRIDQDEAGTRVPLEDFLDEVLEIVAAEPDVREILVEDVKYLRNAEANGVWSEAFEALGGL